MNEFDFIRQLRDQIQSRKHSGRLSVGIGDDAAVIKQPSDRDFVITTDLLVEGIDFHAEAISPSLLGHKALAVSLSDIAAMGARPLWSLISIGLPKDAWEYDYRDEFFAGYLALADRFGVTLTGGDVSEAGQIVIDSIVVGETRSGRAVLRSTARPGDQIFVTGTLGGAAAGLKLIELGASVSDQRQQEAGGRKQDHVSVPGADRGPRAGSPRGVVDATGSTDNSAPTSRPEHAVTEQTSDDDAINSLLLRQLSPQPRVGWGIVLGEEQFATSMIDISDGLSSDLHHLCGDSHVGAMINAASIPLDESVVHLCGRRALDPLALALHGGEDFELLFTVAPENVARLPKRVDGVAISRIGEITSEPASILIHEKTRSWPLLPQGFSHFTRRKPQ